MSEENYTLAGLWPGPLRLRVSRRRAAGLLASTALLVGSIGRAAAAIGEPVFAEARLVASRATVVAGEHVHFCVEGVGLMERTWCDFETTFSTEAAEDYPFAYLDGTAIVQKTAGKAGGYAVGHCYRTPGSHTVTTTAWFAGAEVWSGSVTITVLDPETAFAGRTWFYSQSHATPAAFKAAAAALGIDDSLPEANYLVGTDWTDLQSQAAGIVAANAPERCRFLLVRGQSYAAFNTSKVVLDRIYLDSAGSAADLPTVHMVESGALVYATNDVVGPLRVGGLRMTTPYDPVNPSVFDRFLNQRRLIEFGRRANTHENAHVTVDRVETFGLADNYPKRQFVGFFDSHIGRWFNYGIFVDHSYRPCFAGLLVAQDENAVNGPRLSTAVGNIDDRFTNRIDPDDEETWDRHFNSGFTFREYVLDKLGVTLTAEWIRTNCLNAAAHGPFRAGPVSSMVAMHQCAMRSYTGWSRDAGWTAQNMWFSIQPCIRVFTSIRLDDLDTIDNDVVCASLWDLDLNNTISIHKSGANPGVLDADGLAAANWGGVRIDRLYMEVTRDKDVGVSTSYPDVHVTNAVFHALNANKPQNGVQRPNFWAFQTGHFNRTMTNEERYPPSFVTCSTLVARRGGQAAAIAQRMNDSSGVARPVVAYDCVAVTTNNWSGAPRPEPVGSILPASDAVGPAAGSGVAHVPGPTSPLAGAGRWDAPPRRDVMGRLRPRPPEHSAGAFEPAS